MRIAIISQTFAPDIGGVATISRTLAESWVNQGHEVDIFTRTTARSNLPTAYRVHRHLGVIAGARLIQKCDLILQNHVSLWGMAVHLLTQRRCLIWLQAPIGECSSDFRSRIGVKILSFYARHASRVAAISKIVAHGFKSPPITGNPYNAGIFLTPKTAAPLHSLLFCGRLEAIKGPEIFLQALKKLSDLYPEIKATIVGSGQLDEKLRSSVRSLGLENTVVFAGPRTPEETAQLMRNHGILAVPSIWDEPFGVVALEGIASGCYVVGFSDGGLPDAIGKAGILCSEKNPLSLSQGISQIWDSPALRKSIDTNRSAHLAQFTPEFISKRLLQILDSPNT